MSDISIRPATREDFETWLAWRKELWAVTDLDDELRDMEKVFAADTKAVFFIEKKGEGPIGFAETALRDYAEGCVTSPVAYFEAWFVAPGHRKQGIGRRLLEHAEQWARGMGCTEIASDAEIDNDVSIAAHKKLGFRETDRIVTFAKKLG